MSWKHSFALCHSTRNFDLKELHISKFHISIHLAGLVFMNNHVINIFKSQVWFLSCLKSIRKFWAKFHASLSVVSSHTLRLGMEPQIVSQTKVVVVNLSLSLFSKNNIITRHQTVTPLNLCMMVSRENLWRSIHELKMIQQHVVTSTWFIGTSRQCKTIPESIA